MKWEHLSRDWRKKCEHQITAPAGKEGTRMDPEYKVLNKAVKVAE